MCMHTMCRFYQTFFPVSEYERASVFVVKDGSESKSQKVNVYIKRRDRDDQERERRLHGFLAHLLRGLSFTCVQAKCVYILWTGGKRGR